MALSSNIYSSLTPPTADDLFTSTLLNYQPELVDQVFEDYVTLNWLKNNGNMVLTDGGERIVEPLSKGKNETAGWFSMDESLNVTPQKVLTSAAYEWKELAVSVSIAHKEERQNSGKHKILPLLQSRIDNARQSASDLLAQALFATTQADKKAESLYILVDATSTVGTIARGTYSWWQGTSTTSGSFAAQGLSDMRTLFNSLSSSAGKDAPDFIVTTQTVFEYYEGVLQPLERIQDPVMADGGFQSLRFKTAPVVFDSYVPSGVMLMLNSKYVRLFIDSGTNFVVSPFVKPVNQVARTAQIIAMLNVVTRNPRRTGRLTSITA